MKNRVIILTAALLLAMSLSAHAQIGGILDRARQVADAIDSVTGGNQPQQTQQPAANLSINGLWRTAQGNVDSFYDGKGVAVENNSRDWKEAERRGNISIGDPVYRNIRSTGNLTWTAEWLGVNASKAYTVEWAGNVTFTVSQDGRTMQARNSNGGSVTWTRILNNGIDGIWRTAQGNVDSFYDGKGVAVENNSRDWKEAERRGNISIGDPVYRNIRNTGNLTWTAEWLGVNASKNYTVSWAGNVTFTVSQDGRTMQARNSNGGSVTWTRIE